MKKIIAIVAVIATITACLCIGASAYENGDIIEKGTIITFKDRIPNIDYVATYNMQYKAGNEIKTHLTIQGTPSGANIYNSNSATGQYKVYDVTNGWINPIYKRIEILEDHTITSLGEAIAITEAMQSAVKPSLKQTLDNTKAMFTTTLTLATAIIAWLMANQICLVGMYLYITIALSATARRFIKGA